EFDAKEEFITRLVWKSDYSASFQDSIRSDEVQSQLREAKSLLDSDVNGALEIFNTCLLDSAQCMVKRVCVSPKLREKHAWFDQKCAIAKGLTRRAL
ncbi:hypothetical protein BaRGS_00039771, partial [Batillaria attramentaria]